jgi:hypothetical protein
MARRKAICANPEASQFLEEAFTAGRQNRGCIKETPSGFLPDFIGDSS